MSLKEIARKRILEDVVGSIKAKGDWKVLIVDQETMRVISAACRMYDIMELSVTLVEKIDIKRQPLTKMEAIYLLTPKPEIIDLLIEDFKNEKNPLYAAAHVFFTSRVDDSQILKIKKFPQVVSRIKCLKELNFDFIPFEQQVFHLDMPRSFQALFSPESTESGAELRRIAAKIATACATLKEYPIIRYSRSHSVAQSLANLVQERLDDLMRSSQEFGQTANLYGNRAVLLILDRSQDVNAPLLHEFTYQAMIYDLLKVENDHYKFTAATTGGDTKQKEVILGETDPLWSSLRHMHIADTINYILEGFNEFVKENKATKLYKGKVDDLKEMSEAMKAMPMYQEMLGKYSLHINMANECMNVFQAKNLSRIAVLEQDMVTGEDSEGKPVKNLLSSLPPILTDPKVDIIDKLRLLMIYIVSQEGIKDSDRKRLMELANISVEDQGCISNLRFLGVTLLKAAKAKKSQDKDKKKKKSREDAPPYELSRYTPQLKFIAQDLIDGTLSSEDFPYVKEDPSGLESNNTPTSDVKSLRKDKAQPKWADKGKRKSEKPTTAGQRVIIFVAGGATFSEARCIYELQKKTTGREIILGSTSLLTPSGFVKNLRELKKPEQLADDV